MGPRTKKGDLRIYWVPTAYQALTLAVKHKIPLTTREEHPTLDLTIDVADQID